MKQLQGTDTVVLGSGYNDARALTEALVEKLEQSLAGGPLELPSLPEVAMKIRRALADDNVSVSEIARLLGSDPALAARTLRIANSAMFYRGSRPITSLNGAVSQLGYKMVRNVAMSFAAQQVFIGYGSRPLCDLVGAVWRHSVHAAVVSHMLARVRTKLNADEAFLAGLLHEVGEHETCSLEAPDPPTMTAVVAVANYLVEHSEAACEDADFHSKAPSFGALSLDKPTFDWVIRAADVDVRLLTMAFGV